MTETATRHLALRDGRNLSYTDTGSGESGTWIHCHGIPGSRHELALISSDSWPTGIRVIVPDRPGYGGSSPHPRYDLAQHSADIRHLADHLGLERFSVSGFSGGGVFAMATAHDLGERIEKLAITATPAPALMSNPFAYASELTANAWQAAINNPEALALELQSLTESSERLSQALLDAAGESETHYFSTAPRKQAFSANIDTALAQGPAAAATALARDSGLIADPWPFSPANLTLPIRITHGRSDNLVHYQHQRALISFMPDAESSLVDDAGHYGALGSIWI